eukprot:scaffold2324_cov266-Pinguiococcus_pyrenoidosus.AAC.6
MSPNRVLKFRTPLTLSMTQRGVSATRTSPATPSSRRAHAKPTSCAIWLSRHVHSPYLHILDAGNGKKSTWTRWNAAGLRNDFENSTPTTKDHSQIILVSGTPRVLELYRGKAQQTLRITPPDLRPLLSPRTFE